MKTLKQFHQENPNLAEGCRKLNAIKPETVFSYMTYWGWMTNGEKKLSMSTKTILRLKGLKP